MQLSCEDRAEARVIHVGAARVDAAVAIEFKEAVRHAAGGSAERVILDLSEVNFLDSSGLGALVAVMKLIGAERLELAGLKPNVERVFRLTRMDSIFTIRPTLASALATPRRAEAG
jgi:anti-sigma B factor antagonist